RPLVLLAVLDLEDVARRRGGRCVAHERLVEDARVDALAVQLNAHARQLEGTELTGEGALELLEHRALLCAAEEPDGVLGGAVHAEEGDAVADLVRGREEGAVAADRDDEVGAGDAEARDAAMDDARAELRDRVLDL